MKFEDDGHCFACGKDNPIGLKLIFEFEDKKAKTTFTPQKMHQGWIDVTHGGILFTLMDEIMARLIINDGNVVVTSRMDTRFLRPAKTGEQLTITAQIDNEEGKFIYASSKIINEQGKTLASSKGIYAKICQDC